MLTVRTAEWINLIFFLWLGGLAFLLPLPRSRRVAIFLLGFLGVAAVISAQLFDHVLPPLAASIARDWLPAPLILVAYHQGGRFFTRPMESLQARLLQTDQHLFAFLERGLGASEVPRFIRVYLEVAYFFCYPLVPMGVAMLYLGHMRERSDAFWTIVLPPTYLCYAMIPFLPTLPPWLLGGERRTGGKAEGVRAANFFILRHLSIRANTFPSAHVAASIATALALLSIAPPAGLVFLWIAISIAISTVAGRYHFALDALLGALLAAVTFALTESL